MKKSTTVTKTLLLVLTALIWGFTFAFQSMAADYVGTYTYLAARSWIAVLFLIPVVKITDFMTMKQTGRSKAPDTAKGRRNLWIAGAICGGFLCMASAFQQAGISMTTTAKASFITALYVILVPIMSLFLGRKTDGKIWFCVAVSVVGLYFLCFKKGSLQGFGPGDILMLFAAAGFAIQILVVDWFVKDMDPIRLSQMQVGFQGLFATILMLIFEHPTVYGLTHAAVSILFAGVLSSGVAYTLQIAGQKGLNPAIASIAMCLESVFGAIGGWLILDEKLTPREMSGCALMFTAIVLAQLPSGQAKPIARDIDGHAKHISGKDITGQAKKITGQAEKEAGL